MVRREVQRFEVVIVSLDLRTFFDGVSEIAEDSDDFVHCFDDWVFGADGRRVPGRVTSIAWKAAFFRSFSAYASR